MTFKEAAKVIEDLMLHGLAEWQYEDNIPEEQFTVNTGKAKIVLTNKGGDIISYELLEHNDK